MKDRIPTKILSNGALRYGVYDDTETLLRYEYIKPDDAPTEEGTPLCKATLLPDDVAAALGLSGNPQVKDALEKIKTLVDGNTTLANTKASVATGSYTGTGTFGSGSKNSIILPGAPKILIVAANAYADNDAMSAVMISPSSGAAVLRASANVETGYVVISWGLTTSWYGNSARNQLNVSGKSYVYAAVY